MKQYMPLKPVKRGFKLWVLACVGELLHGFALQFQLYTGAAEGSEKGLGARVVKDLTALYQNMWHVVAMDNFFSSPKLMADLYAALIGRRGSAFAPSTCVLAALGRHTCALVALTYITFVENRNHSIQTTRTWTNRITSL